MASNFGPAMEEFRDSLGLTAEEFQSFVEALDAVDFSPKGELLHRLNMRVQGIDPGPSVNWRGERGLAVF